MGRQLHSQSVAPFVPRKRLPDRAFPGAVLPPRGRWTRFECDATETGEKVAAYVLGLLAKGRLPQLPVVAPHYVFGRTFPY